MRPIRKIGFITQAFAISQAGQQKHFDIKLPADCLSVKSILVTNTAYLAQTNEVLHKVGEFSLQLPDGRGVCYQTDIHLQDQGASEAQLMGLPALPFETEKFFTSGTVLAYYPITVNPEVALIRGWYKDVHLRNDPLAAPYRVKIYLQYEKKPLL